MPIGAAMNGGLPANGREADDFYATPAHLTRAICREEQFVGDIHECACGDGKMSDILIDEGYNVVSTDLVDRGYAHGRGGIDFLTQKKSLAPNIVTNPPFDKAEAFIRKALSFPQTRKLVLVLPANFWHAKRRRALFEDNRLVRVYALTWRPDFKGLGCPTMNVIVCVWDQVGFGVEYKQMHKE